MINVFEGATIMLDKVKYLVNPGFFRTLFRRSIPVELFYLHNYIVVMSR